MNVLYYKKTNKGFLVHKMGIDERKLHCRTVYKGQENRISFPVHPEA